MTEWLCFLSWKAVQNQLLCFRRANRHIVWSYPYCSRFRPKNTRLLTLNPDIRSDRFFRFSAASGTLLFAGVKRFLLTTISLLLKKTPNGINAYRKIQCFYNLQAGNIRLFFHKCKDILWVRIRELWLLAAEIGLSFIIFGFISAFQQVVNRAGIYRKTLCRFFYADSPIICFQNQFSSFVMPHHAHLP